MSSNKLVIYFIIILVILFIVTEHQSFGMDANTKIDLKNKVVEMFKHAYGAYMNHAFPADELMPLSCKGRYRGSEPDRGDVDDSLGNFTLTLIDSLDTLAVMGDVPEFEKAVKLVISHTKFDTNVIVSVFETNIRVLGGLLGGHVIAAYLRRRRFAMDWYKDELLTMAKDIGTRLLPAFNTTTGIPYPRINLKHGIDTEIMRNYRDTCTACAGTMILEFAALSRLTGDPVFEDKAHKAMDYLWNQRHRSSDLVGTVINIHNGDWIRRESGVGAGIDSYYEYVLKAYILLGDDSYLTRFNKHYDAVKKYISQGPRFIDVHMHRPLSSSRNFMDALLAFWPGLQVLKGDIQPAIEVHEMLYQVIQRHNFLPEAFTSDFHVHWGHHPLRPEFVESTYFLYKATGDAHYLEVGQKVMENLEALARVPCGFAAIKDVTKGTHEDQMDSFVLAETFKYLYLLYAEKSDVLFDVDDYIFTTEAHLLPLSLSRCNSSRPAELRLSREMYTHLQQIDDETRQEDEYGDSDHNTCPNPQVKYRINYAHNLRASLKDMVGKTSTQSSPIIQQCPQASPSGPRLKAVDFVAGNVEQLQQLTDMGIKLMTMADGRIQLLHTASEALTTEMAENGLLFMQEMISLSKTQPQDNQNEPMLIKVLTPPNENIIFKAGPAQFGYDLRTRPNIKGKLIVGNPYKMCSSTIVNRAELKGKIVLIERGNCMFVDKARHLQAAGAVGGIVIDHNAGSTTETQPLFAMSGDSREDVFIPLLFLYHNEGQQLIQLMMTDPDLEVVMSAKLELLGPDIPTVDQSVESEKSHDPLPDSDEEFDEEFDDSDIISIVIADDGTKQLYFRFDKLKQPGKDPDIEHIYNQIWATLLKKTNFGLLEDQSIYLTVIMKLLQTAYFGKKLDKHTHSLFQQLSNEIEFLENIEDNTEEKIDETIDQTSQDSSSSSGNPSVHQQNANVQVNWRHVDVQGNEEIKVINANGVGIKIRAKVVSPVKENLKQPVVEQSYADENDFDESENSNLKTKPSVKYSPGDTLDSVTVIENHKTKTDTSYQSEEQNLQSAINEEPSHSSIREEKVSAHIENIKTGESTVSRSEEVGNIDMISEEENDYAMLQEHVNPEFVKGLKKVIDDSAKQQSQTGSDSSQSQVHSDNEKKTTSPEKESPSFKKPVFEKTVKNLKTTDDKKSRN